MSKFSIKFWASISFAVLCLGALYIPGRRESQSQREADISEAALRRLMEMPDISLQLDYRPDGSGICILNEQRRLIQSL
jgi:hypothetical protein